MADYVANENVNEEESSAFNLAAICIHLVNENSYQRR